MANYRIPQMPLPISIWRYSSHLGIIPPAVDPDVESVANLTIGTRLVGGQMMGAYLLCPVDCDIRSSESGVFSSILQTDRDLVEVPSGSGRYYSVTYPVEYSGLGFANAHKIVNITPGYILPENFVL